MPDLANVYQKNIEACLGPLSPSWLKKKKGVGGNPTLPLSGWGKGTAVGIVCEYLLAYNALGILHHSVRIPE